MFRNDDKRDAVKLISPGDKFVTTDIKTDCLRSLLHLDILGFKRTGHFYRWTFYHLVLLVHRIILTRFQGLLLSTYVRRVFVFRYLMMIFR